LRREELRSDRLPLSTRNRELTVTVTEPDGDGISCGAHLLVFVCPRCTLSQALSAVRYGPVGHSPKPRPAPKWLISVDWEWTASARRTNKA
jgi:hypothetical protein